MAACTLKRVPGKGGREASAHEEECIGCRNAAGNRVVGRRRAALAASQSGWLRAIIAVISKGIADDATSHKCSKCKKKFAIEGESEAPVKPRGTKARRGTMVAARRVGKGENARVVMSNGKPAPEHIQPGMVSPAWKQIRISLDPDADLLVTARDRAGRVQSVYRESYSMEQAAAKFARIDELIREKDGIFRQIEKDMASSDEAACMYLISQMAVRPGSDADRKAAKRAFGATTLLARHVVVKGDDVYLDFTGKKGVRQKHLVENPVLAKMLVRRKNAGGGKGNHRLFSCSYDSLRKYSNGLGSGGFSPKDFRTLKATTMAADLLKGLGTADSEKRYKEIVKDVATQVSEVLGNKPAQCITSYISSAVWSVLRPTEV